MKISANLFRDPIRRFLSGVSCAAASLCVCAPLYGAVLLEDDFSGSTLDTSKWAAVIPNRSGSGIVIENGAVKITNRAHLNTVREFNLLSDKSLVGGLEITGQFKFTNGTDFFQLLTRSDGDPSASYSETKTGVEIFCKMENNGLGLSQRTVSFTNTNHFTNYRTTDTPNDALPTQGEYYNFRLVDTGGPTGNAYFEISSLDGSQVWNYSYRFTGMPETSKNLVTFHNRENGSSGLFLDNIRIATTFDSTTPYLSDDFDNGLDPTKWTMHHPKGGSISVSDSGVHIKQRSYLNTFQNFDPSAFGEDAPLTITMDWKMSNTGDMLQVLTRSDGLAAGGYGESNAGVEFYVSDNGTLQIRTQNAGSATNLVSSETKLAKYVDLTYAVTITDNGKELTFDVYEKSDPNNRVTVSAESDYRLNAADGQFVSIHNRESSGYTGSLGNVNIYYATSDFQNVGSLAWTENGLAATAYRQNAEGAVINTISTGTAGVAVDKSGWQLFQGPTADPSKAVFLMGGDGMLGTPDASEVFSASNGIFSFENGSLEGAHWTVVNAGRTGNAGNVFRGYGYSKGEEPVSGEYLLAPGGECGDNGQGEVGLVRSLAFQLTGDGSISYSSQGGIGGTESIIDFTSEALIEQGVSGTGFMGAGLRLVDTDEYILSKRGAANSSGWSTLTFTEEELASLYEADPDAWYTLDFIDAYNGGWGWMTVDDVSIPYLADVLSVDQNQYHFLYVGGELMAMTDPIPEPASIVLLLLGSAGLYFVRKKK